MADLLFEIGCEELPVGVIDPSLGWMKEYAERNFADLRLTHGHISVQGTPRRLVLMVRNLAERQPDRELELLGPKVQIAYGSDGKLTQAGLGFLRSKNLSESVAYRKMTDKGELLAATVSERGLETQVLLVDLLSKLLIEMPFPKRQRWEDSGMTFIRPVRWLLCLLGDEVIPVQFAGVTASNQTCGHRFMSPRFQGVSSIDTYLSHLKHHFVMLDGDERKNLILEGANALAKQAGGDLRSDNSLIEIVKNLVEYPWPIMGYFEEKYLEIPPEILVSEMREHQKYLSVIDAKGKLLPVFIVVAGSQAKDTKDLAAGNGRVLRARFEDGAFYYREDCEKSIDVFEAKLEHVMFQRELGSVADKVRRIVKLSDYFCDVLGAPREKTLRVAKLCKFDLVTGVVGQFPELQGVMGRTYAQRAGESGDVAVAIEQHYWPRFSGDAIPSSDMGAIVSLADRLDTLVAVIGIGKAPKGNADPFGLRRSAIGFIRIIVGRGYRLSIRDAVSNEQVIQFIEARVRGLLLEEFPTMLVDAAMGAGSDDLTDLWARVNALAELERRDPELFAQLGATLKRAGNIVAKTRIDHWNRDALQSVSEKDLWRAIEKAQASKGTYSDKLEKIAQLKPLIDRFFDEVMVMVDDLELRTSRLGLLSEVEKMVCAIADFTKVNR